jgi:hypothetical protein
MNKSVIDIIRESLKVDANGVSFRTRTGRGSGCGVSIPADQLPEVVKLLQERFNAFQTTQAPVAETTQQ